MISRSQWGAEPVPGPVPTAVPAPGGPAPDEWNVAPTTATRDWGADDSEWSAADGKVNLRDKYGCALLLKQFPSSRFAGCSWQLVMY